MVFEFNRTSCTSLCTKFDYICSKKEKFSMKIDINGCFADDIHAICIKRGEEFFTIQPEASWSEDITICAGFLNEKSALLCIEEMKSTLDMEEAVLIWTDTRKSIYSDMEGLRKFEEENRRKE